jgi:4-amino-4-deoxy-L-arabinose transferase-like glycosyltransferase
VQLALTSSFVEVLISLLSVEKPKDQLRSTIRIRNSYHLEVAHMDFHLWVKKEFNKWRIALVVFLAFYAFLLLGLGNVQIQWDEMPHLYGGLLLAHGQLHEYLLTYGYYPPLYDLITAGSYKIFGVSVATGRIAVTAFTILSLWVVFEFAYKTYGPKVALISSILLGSMPGFYWVSRFAFLESMLLFFFSLTLFFFFTWISKNQNKALFLSGLALGLGFLAKYQILVSVLIMIASILLFCRNKLRMHLNRFSIVLIVALAVVVPWLLIIGVGHFGELLYAIQAGGQDRTLYSVRFFVPVFYLVELTWPYNNTHPIFLPVYILGLLGLGLWAFRRKKEDQFFLAWFIIVYIFFTFIPNRQWRYVIPVFSVLAISAASFILFAFEKASNAWKSAKFTLNKKRLIKVAAAFFIIFTVTSVAYSYYDGNQWVSRYQIFIPIAETTNYAAERLGSNQSLMVLCASNTFYQDMVKFYLNANGSRPNQVLQYPEEPVDAFTPNFDVNQVIALCQHNNVKYLLIYEYGAIFPYFNSTLTTHEVLIELLNSGNFTYETRFGTSPRSISVLSFAGAT